MSAPLVCVGDVWVLPMRTVGTWGQGGQSPSISPGLQAKRRPSKGLELPHPPDFQTFLRPFSWLSSISWELLRRCPTHHISTMVISHKLSSRELARRVRHRRGAFRTHFRSKMIIYYALDQSSAIWNSIWWLNLLTTIKFGTWLHHEIIIESYMLTFCSDIILILEFRAYYHTIVGPLQSLIKINPHLNTPR